MADCHSAIRSPFKKYDIKKYPSDIGRSESFEIIYILRALASLPVSVCFACCSNPHGTLPFIICFQVAPKSQ
jgi:hypothetical protein